ncbi:MAG: DUF2817 domain-containing protein, partial [Patescibacteria group bacterium]
MLIKTGRQTRHWTLVLVFCLLFQNLLPVFPASAATTVTYSSQAEFASAISQTGSSTTATPGALEINTLSTTADPSQETRDIAVLENDDVALNADIDFYLNAYFPNFDYSGDEAVDDVLEFADVDELSDLTGYELLLVAGTTTTEANAAPASVIDAFADAGGIVVTDTMVYSVMRQDDTYTDEVSRDYVVSAIRDMAYDGSYFWTLDDTSPERVLKIDPANGSVVAEYCAPNTTPRSVEYVSGTLYISDSFADKIYAITPAGLSAYDGVCATRNKGTTYNLSDLTPAPGSPWGLTYDGSTYYYLVDSVNDTLYQFSISGATLVQNNAWALTLTPRPVDVPRGLAYHDGSLYFADEGASLIYQLSTTDGSVEAAYDGWDGWASDLDLTGVAFVGDDLWVTDNAAGVQKLYNLTSYYLDKDSFEYMNKGNTSFETPSVDPKGLVYDGTYFWVADDYTNRLYKLNATTGAVVSSCMAPWSRPSGLAYYSGNLYVSDWNSDTIYVVNATTCATSSSYASPSTSPHGLVHDGTNLWHADSTSSLIYKLNPATGAVVSSFASPAASERGLAWDGTYLWIADETNDLYYQINPSDGSTVNTRTVIELSAEGITFKDSHLWSVDDLQDRIYDVDSAKLAIGQFATPGTSPRGFAYDGTYIWSVDDGTDKLYKLNATTGAIDTSYDTPGDDPKDITYDGSYLWITTDADNNIYKIDPADGTTEATYAAPDTDPYGIVYFQSYLYVTDTVGNQIYKIDPADGTTEESYDAPGSASGPLAEDGTNVWNFDTDERLIYKLKFDSDDEEGIVEGTQDVYTTSIQGIDFIGTDLWTADAYFDMFFDADAVSVAPEIEIDVANDYTSPFSVDDTMYWASRDVDEAFYYHRRLLNVTETGSRTILATSSRGGAAVVYESHSNGGRLIALDTVLLGDNFEISQQTVPAVTLFLNALGIEIHENGVHEETRPTYASLSTDLGNLMTSCAAAFTRTSIGTASNSEPIYSYQYGTTGKPMAVYVSGMHGNEEHGYIPEVRFMQQLCTDYLAGTDRALNIQKNFDIRFIPLMNPYGIMNATRYNANGVDLNRNFDYQWAAFASSTKGSSAFSEVETQAVRDFIVANTSNIVFVNDAHAAMAISPGMTWGYDLGATPPDLIADIYGIFTAENQYRWYEEKAGLGRWLTYDRYTTHDGTVPYFGNWISSLGLVSSTNEVMGKKDVSTQRMIHTNAWYISHFNATFDALSYKYGRSVYRVNTGADSIFNAAITSNATTPAGTSVSFRYGSSATTSEPTIWYNTYSEVPEGQYLFTEVTLERDSYSDTTPSLSDFTISYAASNTAPTTTVPTASEATNGTGKVTVSAVIDDTDDDNTLQFLVEYSVNGGSSYAKATISETPADTTATYGTPDVENDNTYQVGNAGGYVTSSSGANTVTVVWNSATDAPTANVTNARVRITPYDGTDAGTPVESANFTLDNVDPASLASLAYSMSTYNTLSVTWTAATDTRFDHYELWYGTNQSDVDGRTGTATEWDNSDVAALATATTATTTITSLSRSTTYYVKIFAVDTYGNESTLSSISARTT